LLGRRFHHVINSDKVFGTHRAISVSGYVFRGEVKCTDHAFHKVVTYKRRSKNHLMDQIESFRVGDKDSKREDDLLDTFCYGIALALGDSKGF
jgi:hypothetical protein